MTVSVDCYADTSTSLMAKLTVIATMSIVVSTIGPTLSSYGPGSRCRIIDARRR